MIPREELDHLGLSVDPSPMNNGEVVSFAYDSYFRGFLRGCFVGIVWGVLLTILIICSWP
jgi:hypothetical protein